MRVLSMLIIIALKQQYAQTLQSMTAKKIRFKGNTYAANLHFVKKLSYSSISS
jgi:hypothetical protein